MKTGAPSGQALSKDRLRFWLKLLKSSRLIEDEIRRRLRQDFGSTLPRFDVMAALSRAPDGLKMSEISRLLRVSNGNITGIVDTLAREGLAQRFSVPGDRRANLVRLTEKGADVFAEQAQVHEGWLEDILGGMGADDLRDMTELLDRLNATLQTGR